MESYVIFYYYNYYFLSIFGYKILIFGNIFSILKVKYIFDINFLYLCLPKDSKFLLYVL